MTCIPLSNEVDADVLMGYMFDKKATPYAFVLNKVDATAAPTSKRTRINFKPVTVPCGKVLKRDEAYGFFVHGWTNTTQLCARIRSRETGLV